MTSESMPDPISQEQAAAKAVEKYFRARTGEERRQALEELSKCPPAKKIETVEEALAKIEEGLAKIEELENELQKTKKELSDARIMRWALINLLRLIFVLYASCTSPGGWLVGLVWGVLIVAFLWAIWRAALKG